MTSKSLPKILPNVLINKREELIPLLVATLTQEEDEKLRSALVSSLFNLIKNPEGPQRHIILAGCEAFALSAGATKTETELLPLCWEQMRDKHVGRRMLVANACALLAPHLPSALLSSLVLSMMGQNLAEERDTAVRAELIRALAVIILFIADPDKYNQVWELVQRCVVEGEEGSVSVATSLLLPSFALWADELGRLHHGLSTHYLLKINHVLTSAGMSQNGNETVVVKYLECVEAVLPRLYWSILSQGPYAHSLSSPHPRPDLSLRYPIVENAFANPVLMGESEEQVAALTHQFDAVTANEWFESWPAFDFFFKTWLPELMKVAQFMEVGLFRALPATIRIFRNLCCYFGPSFTQLKLRPIFEGMMKECPRPGSAMTPVYCVGVLSAHKSKDELGPLRTFLRTLFIPASEDQAAALALSITFFELWLVERGEVRELGEGGSWSGWWGVEGESGFLDLVWELVVRKEEGVRSLCAALVARLTPRVSLPTLKANLLPALLTLSSDPLRSVKVSAVLGFPRVIQVAGADSDVMEKVCLQLGSVLEENDPFILVPLFRCLAQLAANFPATFRDDCKSSSVSRVVLNFPKFISLSSRSLISGQVFGELGRVDKNKAGRMATKRSEHPMGSKKKKGGGGGGSEREGGGPKTAKTAASSPPVEVGIGPVPTLPGQVNYHSSTDVPVAEFVARVEAGGVRLLLDEYKQLKKANQGIKALTTEAFKQHPLKNRYQDVGCWDQSRVTLKKGPKDDYIHGNFVDGALKPKQFIATQGPIEDVPGQFECTIPDFWTMIWEQNVTVIIMLCQVVEGGKAKCAQYWPEKVGERMEWGSVQIETKDYAERNIEDHRILVTTLEVLKDGFTNTRSVVHFLHSNWPDRKCPPSAYPIVEFIIRCHTSQKKACETNEIPPEQSPMVVHCSAGIGRSGTFLAIDIALNLLNKFNGLNLKELVRLLRTQRHFAVQTPVQYVCCYQAILEYMVKHKGASFNTANFAKDVARVKQ